MGKLILFKLNAGDFATGFDITLQICQDNPEGITHPFTTITGRLPPCQLLTQQYQKWQTSYRSLNQQVRLGSPQQQLTHITNSCQQYAYQLKQTLKNWYHCEVESFAKIREKLLTVLDTQETIRLLIQTEIRELRCLPWHLFFDSFLSQYLHAELAIAPTEYTKIKQLPKESLSIKILAIFGSNQGIDLRPDQEILDKLNNVEIVNLISPNKLELFSHLYEQEFDLLFFAGHSGKHKQTWQGKLHLNETDIISIDELSHALRQAIQKGLKLAIFNSCDGLGLAQDLEALHLSQMIVMREMIPDKVAHIFIQEFLASFAENNPLYLAVRKAREKLQPLEKEYPCATWLPIICQNPASLPLSWQSLQPLDINLDLHTANATKIPDNLAHLILETTIAKTQLTLEYNSIAKTKAEILVNYTDIDLSLSETISETLIAEGGKSITQELTKRKVKQLGQVMITGAGNLKFESIFHGIIYDYQQSNLTELNLVKTIINRCLTLADTNGFSSIAFPVLLIPSDSLTVEKITIAFALAITNYLRSDTNLKQVKIILPHHHPNNTIIDERFHQFYRQLKQFLELEQEISIRHHLLQELQHLYQTRQMDSSLQILNHYQEKLTLFRDNWLNNILQEKDNISSTDYQTSLQQISQQISNDNNQKFDSTITSLHQTYHSQAAQIWQELVNLENEDEIIFLLAKLDTDIDAFAWINDQYELAIASATARQKKVNDMLQNQVRELEKGQQLLQQKLLNLYQRGIIGKKMQGQERSLSFRAYPKINVKVKAEQLPAKFRTEKISYTADKKALKEAHRQGIDLSEIAEVDPNLKVKFGFC